MQGLCLGLPRAPLSHALARTALRAVRGGAAPTPWPASDAAARRQILIANNGMAAAKAIMSIRRWAFLTLGDDQAIQFVAMVRGLREAWPGRALLRADSALRRRRTT